jgi:HEAT repeat protein
MTPMLVRSFLIGALLLVAICGSVGQDQSTKAESSSSPAAAAAPATTQTAAPPAQSRPDDNLPVPDRAWNLLDAGLQEQSTFKRTIAVRVLSLMPGEDRSLRLSLHALKDNKSQVRAAAAYALGELHDKSAITPLEKTLADKDTSVVIASANALLKFKDPAAYKIFYAVLTGDMKGGKGLIASQLDQLKNAKQMALMGFQEGIGFIPYAGMGYDAYRAIRKDDSSPVRSTAARALLDDPDPVTEDALVQAAVADKSEIVRNAALSTLAKRGDPKIIERLAVALNDDKDSVRYSAAATILHLADVEEKAKQPHGASPVKSGARTK